MSNVTLHPIMNTKAEMCDAGIRLARQFCALNGIHPPAFVQLNKDEPLYGLATCAFYRPEQIRIMVDKCAAKGHGGRAWSWPGYAIDRTPYGVIQHELGHHVDHVFSTAPMKEKEDLFSYRIWLASMEKPLTGYLGTDTQSQTFYKEWFAENFRLYVTNPDLCFCLRPRFHQALENRNIRPLSPGNWEARLKSLDATERIIEQARKKIAEVGAHYQQEELVR